MSNKKVKNKNKNDSEQQTYVEIDARGVFLRLFFGAIATSIVESLEALILRPDRRRVAEGAIVEISLF
jgi:hypothetical protein